MVSKNVTNSFKIGTQTTRQLPSSIPTNSILGDTSTESHLNTMENVCFIADFSEAETSCLRASSCKALQLMDRYK